MHSLKQFEIWFCKIQKMLATEVRNNNGVLNRLIGAAGPGDQKLAS